MRRRDAPSILAKRFLSVESSSGVKTAREVTASDESRVSVSPEPGGEEKEREGRTLVLVPATVLVPALAHVVERQALGARTGEAHALEELARVRELLCAALLVPAELGRHHVDDARERLEGGLRVEEREAGAASDDVDRGRGVLAAARPGDLRDEQQGFSDVLNSARRSRKEKERTSASM